VTACGICETILSWPLLDHSDIFGTILKWNIGIIMPMSGRKSNGVMSSIETAIVRRLYAHLRQDVKYSSKPGCQILGTELRRNQSESTNDAGSRCEIKAFILKTIG
jgi:hypothetical protein